MSVIRRIPRVLILVACMLVLATCAPRGGSVAVAPPSPGSADRAGGPCAKGKGNGSPNTPIVCVDDTGATLSVHPDPFRVHDVRANDKQPVVVQWVTVSGANNLGIEMEPGCFSRITCRGNRCTTQVVPAPAGQTGERRCKYDVWTDRHPRLDPDGVVVPCCSLEEPEP